jgi:ribose 5-phosphate isomerase B
MKIFIASDHGGFALKEKLKIYLKELNFEVEDLGNHEYSTTDDYPDYVFPLAEKVVQEKTLGMILGRSGNGEIIAANKIKGAKAVLCLTEKMAHMARNDNNANILSLGADFLNLEKAKKIVKTFLETPFSNNERHVRRLAKIESYESSRSK